MAAQIEHILGIEAKPKKQMMADPATLHLAVDRHRVNAQRE